MRTGKTLEQLSAELINIRDNAKDFIVPASQMQAITRDAAGHGSDGVALQFSVGGEEKTLDLNRWSNQQLAGYADIPKAYYDRILAERPELLVANINHGLRNQAGDKRMVRAYGDDIRGLVSSKYRRLDSHDLVENVMPAMIDGGLQVVSSEITDKRLYLRALSPRMLADVKVGDTVQYGLQIVNSDVGAGSLRVEPLLYRLVCQNGMITQHAFRKFHAGRSLAAGDDSIELLTDSTLRLGEAAFWAEVRDIVNGAMKPEVFAAEINKMRAATEQAITNFNLEEVVEATCRKLGIGLNANARQGVLESLASGSNGAGLNKWGLANAFTYVAEREGTIDFDQTVELERAGGQIIELNATDWRQIAEKKRA